MVSVAQNYNNKNMVVYFLFDPIIHLKIIQRDWSNFSLTLLVQRDRSIYKVGSFIPSKSMESVVVHVCSCSNTVLRCALVFTGGGRGDQHMPIFDRNIGIFSEKLYFRTTTFSKFMQNFSMRLILFGWPPL
jgi:hypothetical protein